MAMKHVSFQPGEGIIQEDLEQKYLSYVQRMPQAMNFDMEHLKSFVKAYIKIPSDVQNQISTIVFEPDEKDPSKREKMTLNRG